MPGYVIHLAVAKVYEKKNGIKDIKKFEQGVIAPDQNKNKLISHYGPDSSHPGLEKCLSQKGIEDEFDEGYFLHLVTDYLFYNKFLEKFDNRIYDDYDKLNASLIKRYNIVLPPEIVDVVKKKEGEPVILDENELCRFIDFVGNLDIRTLVAEKKISIKEKLEDLQI